MKPISLEIQGFGPYVQKQHIDFEKLSEKGIFLIKGDTGSGKTTIFDAMTFALYGGSSGESSKTKAGRNDLEKWRCTQSAKEDDTIVSFTFSQHGRKYIFTRKLVFGRKNLSAKFEAGEIDDEGNILPFFENPKEKELNSKAEELIGLTKEQFRQVVLLPQGQFERFLTASSDEKEAILEKIFGVNKWKNYAENFYAAAKEKKDKLDDLKKEIENSLKEEGLTESEQLGVKTAELKENLKALEISHKNFEESKKQEALNRDISLYEKFKQLYSLKSQKEKLEGKASSVGELRSKLDESKRAESLRNPILSFEEKKKEYEKRAKALKSAEGKIPGLKTVKEEAEKALIEHTKGSRAEELAKLISVLEDKRPAYENMDALRSRLKSAEGTFKKAEREYEEAAKGLSEAFEKAKEAKEKFDKKDELAKQYRDRYFAGIYGEIAASLEEGESCPVCGSTAHPMPAERHLDAVSKSDMEKKENESIKQKKIWESEEKARIEKQNFEGECKEKLNKAEIELNKAKAEFEALKGSLVEEIEDSNALKRKIDEAEKEKAAYEEKEKNLKAESEKSKEELLKLEEEIKVKEGEVQKAAENFKEAEESLNEKLKELSFENHEIVKGMLVSDKQRDEWQKEIVEYDKSCKTIKEDILLKEKELEGENAPDAGLFKDRQKEINEEIAKYEREKTSIENETARLERKGKIIGEKEKKYEAEIYQAGNDLTFAKKLRGDTGIGIQRYVLAIMFSQVIGEANRMLSKVHGGRYYLFRSDEKGTRNKRGLELKVHDSRSPESEGRSVLMLSGGEKFLVSLALSIGLSSAAQRTGVSIEALFIDEGFGSLDESSINDAMDVLYSVRKGSGMIGIISHVKVLEDNIPDHLEVIKSEKGSSIRMI